MNGYFAPQCLTNTLGQQSWTHPGGIGNYFWQHSCSRYCLVTRVVLTYHANPLLLPVLFSNKMYISRNFIGFYFHFRWKKWQKHHSQLNKGKKASSLQCRDFSSTHWRTTEVNWIPKSEKLLQGLMGYIQVSPSSKHKRKQQLLERLVRRN